MDTHTFTCIMHACMHTYAYIMFYISVHTARRNAHIYIHESGLCSHRLVYNYLCIEHAYMLRFMHGLSNVNDRLTGQKWVPRHFIPRTLLVCSFNGEKAVVKPQLVYKQR